MAYQVLARKWRPKSFESLVGQEHVVQALSNALDHARLHHAYLLTGTRGVGKTTIARIMAKSLNCQTGITSKPCGVCEACQQIDLGRFVDLLEIDAASNTGIDNIREVLENAQYAPTSGRFKIYIIDEVHMLSKSAFNAMLKTLEEPPPHVKFILATTDPHKVPVTILSRCLQFALKQMTPHLIAQHLAVVLSSEKIPYEVAGLNLLGHAASGSMRDALSLLDQAIAYGAGSVTAEGIRTMLGAVDQRYMFDLLYALKAQDGAAILNLIDGLHAKAVAFEAALTELIHILHQIAVVQIVPNTMNENTPHREDILVMAKALTPEDVQLYYQIALHGRRDLALATDEYAGFSMTILRMLAFAPSNTALVKEAISPVQQDQLNISTHIAQENSKETSDVGGEQVATHLAREKSAPPDKHVVQTELIAQGEEIPIEPIVMPSSSHIPLQEFAPEHWTELITHFKGMAMMLAQNSVLVSLKDQNFLLRVANKDSVVTDRQYQDKLRIELSAYFGVPITLRIEVEESVDDTPLILKARAKDQRQEEAEMAIQEDPLVQNLIVEFGANIVPHSIKPIE